MTTKQIIKLNYIETYFNIVSKIITVSTYCLQNLLAISKVDGNGLENQIRRWPFFLHYQHHMFYICTVELTKLFSESGSHHYSYFHLLKKLIDCEYDDQLMLKLETNRQVPVSEFQGELIPNLHKSRESVVSTCLSIVGQIKTNDKSIKRLKAHRDKVYAHYDEDLPGMVLAISADDLKKLAALASYIYNQLYGRLFDVDTSFSLPEAKVDSIISALAKTIKH